MMGRAILIFQAIKLPMMLLQYTIYHLIKVDQKKLGLPLTNHALNVKTFVVFNLSIVLILEVLTAVFIIHTF